MVFYLFLSDLGPTLKLTTIYFLGLSIPHLLTLYLFWSAFEMFTPILGRSGTEIPPDIVMAAIIAACAIILTTYFVSDHTTLLLNFKNAKQCHY